VTVFDNYSIKPDYSITSVLHLCNQIPRNKDRQVITKYYIRTGHLIYDVSVNSLSPMYAIQVINILHARNASVSSVARQCPHQAHITYIALSLRLFIQTS